MNDTANLVGAFRRIEQVRSEIRVGAKHNLGDALSYPTEMVDQWLVLLDLAGTQLAKLIAEGGNGDG